MYLSRPRKQRAKTGVGRLGLACLAAACCPMHTSWTSGWGPRALIIEIGSCDVRPSLQRQGGGVEEHECCWWWVEGS